MTAAHPGQAIDLLERPNRELQQLVGSGKLDLALTPPVDGITQLRDEYLYDEPLVVALPMGHELQHVHRLSIHDIADQPTVMPSAATSPAILRRYLDLYRRAGHPPPPVAQQASSPSSLLILVAAGAGLAIVPAQAGRRRKALGVEIRPLNAAHSGLPIHMISQAGDTNPLLHDLREALKGAVTKR